ncbi:glycine cleavage system aminomethyltransferase GcvT [Actinophytocola sp.]|uniref:glycine cleavage system aminomethyltransferase GcvT n=1 Tax=Actinophytocola sp. TaxID=1872138 RepID=UPI002D7E27B5|nr:glycine cleavage system aminomethyltransferase GcvT [Actinophytocola sp.]HET9143912.1 glycine cleavage system aminomethyltransferase GcvT [Actinophytocola sp.]
MTISSPLHEVHSRLGATFTDFAGWSMPLKYGSELAEHRAVRQAAGLFDLSHMGEIELTGPEAGRALDFALVGHLSAVKVGRARYSVICNADGGVLDDLVVYRLGEDHYLVVANASNAALVAGELRDRAEGFLVEVADKSMDCALIAVQGPKAAEIIDTVCVADLEKLPYYGSTPTTIAGHEVLLARTGYTGEDGFEVYADTADAVDVWQALSDAGAQYGLVPAGLACRDTLRLEAGMALYGNELTVDTNPFEAGLGRVVKFDKPADFVGREPLAAKRDAGVSATLVGLAGTGRRAPRHGYPVLSEDGSEVGTVTSGALSPTLGVPIAMAFVPTALSEPGTKLAVDIRGTRAPVEVVKLPFYKRPT